MVDLPAYPASRAYRGAAAVSFILAFPIFLVIVAILVQYALIANARVMVDHAAQMAARAAVTSLPEEHPENVESAAYMVLSALSPVATSTSPEATTMYDSLKGSGVDVPEKFAGRYSYAMDATSVSWSPEADFPYLKGQEIEVTVRYRFRLTVPAAMMFVGQSGTVGGISGRFIEFTSKCRTQTAHGRKAQ